MCDKISTDELQLPMMDLPSMTPQIICVKNDLYLYNDINQDTAKRRGRPKKQTAKEEGGTEDGQEEKTKRRNDTKSA